MVAGDGEARGGIGEGGAEARGTGGGENTEARKRRTRNGRQREGRIRPNCVSVYLVYRRRRRKVEGWADCNPASSLPTQGKVALPTLRRTFSVSCHPQQHTWRRGRYRLVGSYSLKHLVRPSDHQTRPTAQNPKWFLEVYK